MPKERNKIFISHASPEDNDFTIWLASRLQLLGYQVWIDKDQLLGGETFWQEIDLAIRNDTAKFLLVYSKDICKKDSNDNPIHGNLKEGVSKEYILADSIAKEEKIDDFIILLNTDGSNFNLFIDAPRLNQIPFHNDWASGFEQLVKKLKKDNIPTLNENTDRDFGEWYQHHFLGVNSVEPRRELYHSNWWEIKTPEYFYIYELSNETQAKEILKQNVSYPMSRISNHLSSFEKYELFKIDHQEQKLDIKPESIFKLKISDILLGFDSDKFPTQRDSENSLKYLLNRVFHLLMKKRNLSWYEMANKRQAYYYTKENLPSLKTRFPYPHRPEKDKHKYKLKNLIGEYGSLGNWHYAISSRTILSPLVAFSLKGHLTFSKDGYNLWKDTNGDIDKVLIHRHRRKKGRRFFNEEWRDMLLAFLHGLKVDGKINLALSSEYQLEMSQYPENFWSEFGYVDPREKDRHGIFSEENSYETDEVDEYGAEIND